jgi:A/G-specific adenine glycosylase
MTNMPGSHSTDAGCTPGMLGTCVARWYRQGHRALPWRETTDPYRILVSEIMLQQTRAETVTGYYGRFLKAFPDTAALASADPEQVMNQWKGLGYYSRARNLQKAAQAVMRDCGGVFPDTMEGLRSLPGVGPYTIGAIMSIAFGKPVPAVDGNVLRVMARLYGLDGDIGQAGVKREVTSRVSRMIPHESASDFCQGMMELGATVCMPSSPKCPVCPVAACCLALASGCQADLPVRHAKPAPVESRQIVCVIRDPAGRVLVEYRQKGLLSGLWGLPHYESDQDRPDPGELPERLGLISQEDGCDEAMTLGDSGEIGRIVHTFTHRRWFMLAWAFAAAEESGTVALPERYRWVESSRLKDMPIPEAFQKILRMSGLLHQHDDLYP